MKRGVHAILYALFDADERLDRAAMRQQIQLCLGVGVAGVAALGLATEVAKLAFDERKMLMDWVSADVGGRVPLGFTIYGQSVAEQVAMVRHAEGVGADWLILQPPMVGNYGPDEYLGFFSRVMAATALPMAIQNAPQYLGRGLSDDDIGRLRDKHAQFTLIKSEATAAECARLIANAGPTFQVFNGRGGQDMIACLDAGCAGFLLAPDLVDYGVRVMELYDAGDHLSAEKLHDQTLPAIGFVMQSIEHLICYGKRLFCLRAGMVVHDRAPALRPDAVGQAQAEALARTLGQFSGQRSTGS